MCKQCLTMHVDNFDPQTFLWILQKLDAPWVPVFWNRIRDKQYTKHNGKLKGTSVIGKYLSQVKVKQYKKYTWATSEQLRQEVSKKEKVDEQALAVQQEQIKKQFIKNDKKANNEKTTKEERKRLIKINKKLLDFLGDENNEK